MGLVMRKRIFSVFLLCFICIVQVVVGIGFDMSEPEAGRYIHISFDDTISVFQDITENKDHYNSCFDNYFLGYLKWLHDEYGAVFSLYCFYFNNRGDFNLSMCTGIFAEEFQANSDWLKFGFHSYTPFSDFADISYEEVMEEYEKVTMELSRITGGGLQLIR